MAFCQLLLNWRVFCCSDNNHLILLFIYFLFPSSNSWRFSLKSKWQQMSSTLWDSSRYSCWSQNNLLLMFSSLSLFLGSPGLFSVLLLWLVWLSSLYPSTFVILWQGPGIYVVLFSFILTLLSAGTRKSTSWYVCFFLLNATRSVLLVRIDLFCFVWYGFFVYCASTFMGYLMPKPSL